MTTQDRTLLQGLLERQRLLEQAMVQLRRDFRELEERASEMDAVEAMPLSIPTAPVITQIVPQPELPPLPVVTPEVPPVPQVEAEPVVIVANPLYAKKAETPVEAKSEPVVESEVDMVAEPTAVVAEIPAAEEFKVESWKEAIGMPPLPEISQEPGMEKAEPVVEEKHGGFEFQFGRWLARIGVVFALITLISFSTLAYKTFHREMGPWSKLGFLTVVSVGLIAGGLRIERKNPKLVVYGRTLAGGGLACLYYTLYGATYVSQLQVIQSEIFGGMLLLAWSAYVLYLAEKKKSELLSVFAIALAYFSSAITPVGEFTMAANLILSVTAVVFLVRNAWTGLSYLCLVGTYLAVLQQFVKYDSELSWFTVVQGGTFWPVAIYLAGAWVIYTAGVFLAKGADFAAGKRMAFLCLNNGGLAGLMATAAALSGFGHLGAILCLIGCVFIAASYLNRAMRADATEVAGAYLMQGLALGTGGLVMAYTGVTRGLLITVESVFLAGAGAFARNWIMKWAGYVSALLGTLFLLGEIYGGTAYPWVLIVGGAAAMLANGWLARREFWTETLAEAGQHVVAASAYYVALGTLLLGMGIEGQLSAAMAAPVLAGVAVALTLAFYLVPLTEMALFMQLLMVFALRLAVLPADDSHPWWSELGVGGAIMVLVAWWPRQTSIRTMGWLQPLLAVYALGMVGVSACAVHPHVSEQGWMISASLLSLAFLAYGVYGRTRAFALAGQTLLVSSVWTFFDPAEMHFPWTWWAAAVPIATTYATAAFVQRRLHRVADHDFRDVLQGAVFVYQGVVVALVARFIFGLVPDVDVPLAFYLLGTAIVGWNIFRPSVMGVRYATAFTVCGTLVYLAQASGSGDHGATWQNAVGLLFLLAQPVILRRWGATLVSKLELTAVTFLANGSVSLYVYYVIHPHVDAQGWMIAASLISLVYLAYGAWARLPQFILSGQVYLALAIGTFFNPPLGAGLFPWVWWAAALPPAVVFVTGWLAHRALPRLPEGAREAVRAGAYCYQAIALFLVTRWVYGIVPADEITLTFFVMATGLLAWNLYRPDAFGARTGLVMSGVASVSYLSGQIYPSDQPMAWPDALGFALFIAQPALLRQWGRELFGELESWVVILVSAGMGWIFVSNSIDAMHSHNMTLGWAIFALVLVLAGFAANERRQRWCGLVVLVAAMIRVGVYDFWSFSDLYKVLTFFALTVICLGLSFLYYKFADRLKEWL